MTKQNEKNQKWKIVEEITAIAHRSSGVVVKKNARLPCLRRGSNKKRYREIDVLLSSRVAGHSVHFAIECKALSRPVSSPQIDAFIGKLQDIGISPQTSVFVSASGYYDSAVERASEVGIKTLLLKEADYENFPIRFRNAIQMSIFMVCFYKGFTFQTQEPAQGHELFKYLIFYDKKAKVRGAVIDLIWWNWLKGKPPLKCGQYEYNLTVPKEWRFLSDGKPSSAKNFKVKLEVNAFIMKLEGIVDSRQFHDVQTGKVDRHFMSVDFGPEIEHRVKLCKTESELLSSMEDPADIKVKIGRIRLPKIVMDNLLTWPMSKAAWKYFANLNKTELSQSELERVAEINMESFWSPLPFV